MHQKCRSFKGLIECNITLALKQTFKNKILNFFLTFSWKLHVMNLLQTIKMRFCALEMDSLTQEQQKYIFTIFKKLIAYFFSSKKIENLLFLKVFLKVKVYVFLSNETILSEFSL